MKEYTAGRPNILLSAFEAADKTELESHAVKLRALSRYSLVLSSITEACIIEET